MTTFAAALRGQVGTEVRIRMRSPATVIAVLAILAGTYFWIPRPTGNAVSMSWTTVTGVVEAPIYNSAALGISVTIFAGIFLTISGYYFVSGSIRRDRESGVGQILAATPLSNAAYVAGKFAACFAYLGVLALAMLAVGLFRFLLEGVGPLEPAAFLAPFGLVVVPALLFVAALITAFDVLPVTRSRAGTVVWFFAIVVVMAGSMAPGSRDAKPYAGTSFPVFDPTGTAALEQSITASIPAAKSQASVGHIILDKPPRRVPWNGIAITKALVTARLLSLFWCIIPFAVAVAAFDRFDPARGKRGKRSLQERFFRRRPAESNAGAFAETSARTFVADAGRPAPKPSLRHSVVAEALLIGQTAPLLRWPLAVAAVVGAFIKADGLMIVSAVWLVLIVPVISEASAREELAGTRQLIDSEPGVPLSRVVWKFLSVAAFLFVAAVPLLLRWALVSPAHGAAFAAGLLFVAAFAVGAGILTRGGKLFAGLYLSLWYVSLNGLAEADFCGISSRAVRPDLRLIYLGIGATWLAAAALRERVLNRR